MPQVLYLYDPISCCLLIRIHLVRIWWFRRYKVIVVGRIRTFVSVYRWIFLMQSSEACSLTILFEVINCSAVETFLSRGNRNISCFCWYVIGLISGSQCAGNWGSCSHFTNKTTKPQLIDFSSCTISTCMIIAWLRYNLTHRTDTLRNTPHHTCTVKGDVNLQLNGFIHDRLESCNYRAVISNHQFTIKLALNFSNYWQNSQYKHRCLQWNLPQNRFIH